MKKKKEQIIWNENGWTAIQDADAAKHVLEISCRTENGVVVEVRTRHNDGETQKGVVTLDGKNVLPISIADFDAYWKKGVLDIK